MLLHPAITQLLAIEHVDALRRAARRPPAPPRATAADETGIELRLCRADDDPALEQLAALAEQPLPFGRFVVAIVDGRLVAALPLAGGHLLADPFARTLHLRPLLELRAAQLRAPVRRRRLLPRYAGLIRGSIHA